MSGRVRFGLFLAVSVVCSSLGSGCTTAPDGPTNVLLVTLDTVRADRLGSYGNTQGLTPHMDALAAGGVRFSDAVSSAPITGPAHASLLTGRYATRFGVRDNVTTPLPADAETLAERLSAAGYDTGGFIGAFILGQPYGFAQGFDTFDGFATVESGTEANAERRGDSVVDAASHWLTQRTTDRPFFAWVHLYDAHAPYTPPAPYDIRFPADPYDGEVAYVDAQVGRLLDALRAQGTLDQTLVLLIADHGESLGEHGEDEHGVFLYESVMHVPWIMSGPGLPAGTVVGTQVRSVDLVPTVLAALRLPPSSGGTPGGAPFDGVDLSARITAAGEGAASASDAGPPPTAYGESYYPQLHYGWSELRSIRADGWKVIDAPTPELYNLAQDPGETTNLYSSQQTLADRMIAEAVRLEREFTNGQSVAVTTPDASTLERLRSLGYVGASAPLPPTGQRGPDPKDRIAERREFNALMNDAIDDLRSRRVTAAIPKFKRLLAINNQAYDVHQFLGEAYQAAGDLNSALGEFEFAAAINPGAPSPRLSAAEVHLAQGDTSSARRRLDEAAALAPESFDVSIVTGRVLEAEDRPSEALSAYERAVRQNGANPRARTLLVGVASRLQRYDVAEAQLTALLGMGYQPSRTHFALGRLAQLRGRIDDAERHYREALRLEPGLAMATEGLRQIGR